MRNLRAFKYILTRERSYIHTYIRTCMLHTCAHCIHAHTHTQALNTVLASQNPPRLSCKLIFMILSCLVCKLIAVIVELNRPNHFLYPNYTASCNAYENKTNVLEAK